MGRAYPARARGQPLRRESDLQGGSSLAKAYRAIRRFSEDLDITHDIRAIAADLVEGSGDDALPATRSQERKWTREIRGRLAGWVENDARPATAAHLSRAGLSARVRAEGDRIVVGYEPLFPNHGFVRPQVLVEFGARSTGEPRRELPVECDAAPHVPEVTFPSVSPFVMSAGRTFWEKATAMHVFCRQLRGRGERLSRHWYDLVRLDDAGLAEGSLTDHALALSVARHKAMFFREKDAAGSWIDYEAAVSGELQLVPRGAAYHALADDYGRMLSDGMLLDDEERFEALVARCADIQARANRG